MKIIARGAEAVLTRDGERLVKDRIRKDIVRRMLNGGESLTVYHSQFTITRMASTISEMREHRLKR